MAIKIYQGPTVAQILNESDGDLRGQWLVFGWDGKHLATVTGTLREAAEAAVSVHGYIKRNKNGEVNCCGYIMPAKGQPTAYEKDGNERNMNKEFAEEYELAKAEIYAKDRTENNKKDQSTDGGVKQRPTITLRGCNVDEILSCARWQGVHSNRFGTWKIHYSYGVVESCTGYLFAAAETAVRGSAYFKGYIEGVLMETEEDETVKEANARVKAAQAVLEKAEAQYQIAVQEQEQIFKDVDIRLSCMRKLEPVFALLTNDEIKVAAEIMLGLVDVNHKKGSK